MLDRCPGTSDTSRSSIWSLLMTQLLLFIPTPLSLALSPPRESRCPFASSARVPAVPHASSRSPTELGQFTNLRINFTKLPHIARQGYRSPSTFYAVTEMQVLGSCFCHGHADHCAPSEDPHTAVRIEAKRKA